MVDYLDSHGLKIDHIYYQVYRKSYLTRSLKLNWSSQEVQSVNLTCYFAEGSLGSCAFNARHDYIFTCLSRYFVHPIGGM